MRLFPSQNDQEPKALERLYWSEAHSTDTELWKHVNLGEGPYLLPIKLPPGYCHTEQNYSLVFLKDVLHH